MSEEDLERSKSRPLTPADDLVRDLEKARVLLNKLCDRLNKSGVERTFHLRRILGGDCHNYRRSMALFEEEDFEELRFLVSDLNDQFLLLEGKITSGPKAT